MELKFNPCGEFRLSPEGRVSQIHSQILAGVPGIFSDLLKSVLMLERDSGVRKETGSYRTSSFPGKTAALVPEFVVKNLPSEELQFTKGHPENNDRPRIPAAQVTPVPLLIALFQ